MLLSRPQPSRPRRSPIHMDVTFTIREGKRVFVDQVFVSGLNHTRPFVVQREIVVKAGDPLSQIDMLNRSILRFGEIHQVDYGGSACQSDSGDHPPSQQSRAALQTAACGLGRKQTPDLQKPASLPGW